MLIVHLSDIHFREGDGDALDPNGIVRRALEKDLRRLRSEITKPFDVLAITGDISFSGKEAEFTIARSWLSSLCELIGCRAECVLITPGNHDVDRSVVDGSERIKTFHATMAGRSPNELDDLLAHSLRNESLGDEILRPLFQYNAFAAQYGCESTRLKPWWEKALPLAQACQVFFRGLNTALLSSPDNDKEPGHLFVGQAQCAVDRDFGRIHVVLGHHPPAWLRDHLEAERTLARDAALQLFGHRHEAWIDRLDNSVRLFAGALHPDRREANWEPHYNVIDLSVVEDGRLRIVVWARKWWKSMGEFGADWDYDGKATQEFFHTFSGQRGVGQRAPPAIAESNEKVVTVVLAEDGRA